MAKYDTTTKRRVGTYNTLQMIDGMHSEKDNIINQGSMLLSALLDGSGEDTPLRSQAVACANQINGSIDELNCLDGSYCVDPDNPASEWLNISTINLLSYVPSIVDHIKGTNGENVKPYIKDFRNAYSIFKKFDENERRGNALYDKRKNFFYDDNFINQRTKLITKKEYGWMMEDADVNKSKFLGKVVDVWMRNKYKWTMVDMETIEIETDPKPILPSPEELLHVLRKTNFNYEEGIKSVIRTISDLRRAANESTQDYYNQLAISPVKVKHNYVLLNIHDENNTKDFSERVMNTLPDVLYYEFPDKTFGLFRVESKNINKTEPVLKNNYKERYSKAEDITKLFVYDEKELEDYYKNFNYSVDIKLVKISSNYNIYSSDTTVPTNTINDESLQSICDNMKTRILKSINNAKYYYENCPVETRCEDFEPLKHYEEFQNFISRFKPINVQQCNIFIDYVLNTVDPWVDRRIPMLINTTSDLNNATRMIDLLQKRLTKNTGPLLIWYQSLLQFDDSYEDYKLSHKLALNRTKDMLVTNAYDGKDEKIFYNYVNPKYIDISPLDELYTYNNIEFHEGDTIYIESDLKEQKNIIERIETIKIISTDYSNADLSNFNETGIIKGAMNNKINITRLHLRLPLPNWCHTDDVSDIRIVKLL